MEAKQAIRYAFLIRALWVWIAIHASAETVADNLCIERCVCTVPRDPIQTSSSSYGCAPGAATKSCLESCFSSLRGRGADGLRR